MFQKYRPILKWDVTAVFRVQGISWFSDVEYILFTSSNIYLKFQYDIVFIYIYLQKIEMGQTNK